MKNSENKISPAKNKNWFMRILTFLNSVFLLFYIILLVYKNQAAISRGSIEPLAVAILLGFPFLSYVIIITITYIKFRSNRSANFDQAGLIASHVTLLSFLLFLIYCYFAIPII
ncbi:MAG: hypothetical protein JWN75_364 [Candidatus Saccharibacteria bacterium]|nr:hypothetical protein [Candidatus Saccharibacteria bacterium]